MWLSQSSQQTQKQMGGLWISKCNLSLHSKSPFQMVGGLKVRLGQGSEVVRCYPATPAILTWSELEYRILFNWEMLC